MMDKRADDNVTPHTRALTMGQLEEESGVPSQTIHYYLREGLLPPAQKINRSRALYTEQHVEFLREIEALRQKGLRRAEIKCRLAHRLQEAGQNNVDLVARQEAETRESILVAATRSFATKGYDGTRIADLIEELGITPQVLYGHFATKRDLFVACFRIAVGYMDNHLRPQFEGARDQAEKMIWFLYANSGIKAFSPNLEMFALEAAYRDEQARSDLIAAYGEIMEDIIPYYAALRRTDEDPPFSDELVAHALFGAFEQMLARATLDESYSWQDCASNLIHLFLAVQAVYLGELDISEKVKRYAPLLEKVAHLPPPVPEEFKP